MQRDAEKQNEKIPNAQNAENSIEAVVTDETDCNEMSDEELNCLNTPNAEKLIEINTVLGKHAREKNFTAAC